MAREHINYDIAKKVNFSKSKYMATQLSLKEKLHLYIETADEQKLQAIYTLLKDEINRGYSKEEIELFHQRRQNYLYNPGESYTSEDSLTAIRKARI